LAGPEEKSTGKRKGEVRGWGGKKGHAFPRKKREGRKRGEVPIPEKKVLPVGRLTMIRWKNQKKRD